MTRIPLHALASATGWAIVAATLLALFAGAASAGPSVRSDDAPPTFYRDVLPILQRHCQTCHRPAGVYRRMVAPISLLDYSDAGPWAQAVAKAVGERTMPPWHAAPHHHGVFANERALDQADIDTVVRWAESGAPAGDLVDGPSPLEWPASEWSIGEPDLVLGLREPFFVADDVGDLTVNLPLEDVPAEMLSTDRFITAVEVGADSTAVHHITAFALAPRHPGEAPSAIEMLPGIAPSIESGSLPDGFGIGLRTGSKLMLQVHFHKGAGPGTGVSDRSKIAIRFADRPLRQVHVTAVADPRKLVLPPGSKDVLVTSQRTFGRSILVFALRPEMRSRGVSARYVARFPDGGEKTLLEVPSFDFDWQTEYRFREPLTLPAGSTVAVAMGYDNSAENSSNPDPAVEVRWGDSPAGERNLGWMVWAYADPADEDGAIASPLSGL